MRGLDDGAELKRWTLVNMQRLEQTLRLAAEAARCSLEDIILAGFNGQLVATHCVDPADLAGRNSAASDDYWRDCRWCRLPPYRSNQVSSAIGWPQGLVRPVAQQSVA
jgi:hypothetical protein